jgi:hypothetical protein
VDADAIRAAVRAPVRAEVAGSHAAPADEPVLGEGPERVGP